MLNVSIWLPPEVDHAAWQELTGERISRDEFERLATEAMQVVHAEGRSAVFVERSVVWMRQQLAGKDNTPGERAAAIARLQSDPEGRTLGIKITGPLPDNKQAVAFAVIERRLLIGSETTEVTDSLADTVRRILRKAEERS